MGFFVFFLLFILICLCCMLFRLQIILFLFGGLWLFCYYIGGGLCVPIQGNPVPSLDPLCWLCCLITCGLGWCFGQLVRSQAPNSSNRYTASLLTLCVLHDTWGLAWRCAHQVQWCHHAHAVGGGWTLRRWHHRRWTHKMDAAIQPQCYRRLQHALTLILAWVSF